MAPRSLLDLAEHNIIQHRRPSRQSTSQKRTLQRHSAPEHVPHDEITRFNLPHDALLHQFPNARHTDHDGGRKFADIALAIADGGVGEGFGTAVAHGAAPVDAGVFEHELEDVGEGEVGDEFVAGTEVLPYD